jgi:tRNA(Ile)-lysidine synthase
MNTIQQFENEIQKNICDALGDQKEKPVLLAAISGGADSVSLLAALAALKDSNAQHQANFDLSVITINHNLRGIESAEDADFVQKLCGTFFIPCRVVAFEEGVVEQYAKDKGCGIEAAARDLRRAAFIEEAQKINARFVLTAHTQNDQTETIIMRLLRSAGARGLSGIQKTSPLITSSLNTHHSSLITLLRPMLNLTRNDVETYLQARNIKWRTDSTNTDDKFLRNKIRMHIIPVLNKHFPDWKKSFINVAKTQSLIARFLSAEAQKRISLQRTISDDIIINAGDFFSEDQILREEALFQALNLFSDTSHGATSLSNETIKKSSSLSADQVTNNTKVNRDVIRSFACGDEKAVSTGGAIIKLQKDTRTESEAGFSMLIKEGRKYKINGLSIEYVRAGEQIRLVVVRSQDAGT